MFRLKIPGKSYDTSQITRPVYLLISSRTQRSVPTNPSCKCPPAADEIFLFIDLFIPVAKKECVSSIILFRFVNKKSTCRSLASAKEFVIISLGNFTPIWLQAWNNKVLKP